MGRKRERFADVIGLVPRNVFAFLFFVVIVLGLFMVTLILLAYADVRAGFLSGLYVAWPGDDAKVVLVLLLFLLFIWLRVFRRAKKREAEETEAAETEAEETESEETEAAETEAEETETEETELEETSV
jgi:cbb3-type cytochrome oxidase subunit 3